jgi:hypothetical protein
VRLLRLSRRTQPNPTRRRLFPRCLPNQPRIAVLADREDGKRRSNEDELPVLNAYVPQDF